MIDISSAFLVFVYESASRVRGKNAFGAIKLVWLQWPVAASAAMQADALILLIIEQLEHVAPSLELVG